MALGPGDTFGRYTIVEVVGIGGMGQILRAIDNILERNVALKIIRPDRVPTAEALARFFREARLAAKLTHANTLQVYDLGEVNGTPFIAMEHIEGKALTAYCGRVDIPVERKLTWMLDAARGLAAAHRHGLIHRDVKPGNIMVTHDNVVKVVDFGLAKRTSTSSKRFAAALGKRKTFHTDLGFVLGTPAYMAPEQLEGAEIDGRADQYAWALTLYTLIAGKNPRATDPALVALPPLEQRIKGIKRSVATIIAKALAVEPEARHASMDVLVTELQRALFEGAAPPSQPKSSEDVPGAESAPGTVLAAPAVIIVDLSARASTTDDGQVTMHPPEPKPLGRRVWRFERTEHPCAEAPFHAATFSDDGRRIAAFGQWGMAVHQAKWSTQPLAPGLRTADVRCARFAPDGTIVVGGRQGLAARILPSGEAQRWHAPKIADTMVLEGVEITTQGWITFVGRTAKGGFVARVGPKRLDLCVAPVALNAVVTLATGTLLACGPHGALVSIVGTNVSVLEPVTDMNLVAIARLGTGAVAVGADGVAVRIDASFRATVENVRTTSSLTALTTTDVDAWAASAVGRVMKRDQTGVWKRMAPDWGAEPHVLAIWAKGGRVRAVATDASRIGGWRRE